MKLLRTIKRLNNPRDLRLFLNILAMLILLPRLIRKKSLPELLEGIDSGVKQRGNNKGGPISGHGSPIEDLDVATMDKTVGFVDSLLHYRVFQRYGTCLLRSLILFRFLRQQGWPVKIHFGVRKTAEDQTDITGHSWLVLADEPFLEAESQHGSFVTTYTYPE